MLVRAIDRVLDLVETDTAMSFFLLDGQSILVDDYLELRPEREAHLRQHVEAGRIAIGPWYVLADEFLVSGESHARNLLKGRQVAQRVGPPMAVGYLPDAFGHVAQMPQILQLAGLESAVFTRGMGDEIEETGWEFRWRAPDGSEVLALNQCQGYCAAGALGLQTDTDAWLDTPVDVARAVSQVQQLFIRMRPLANGSIVQIANGCDHLPPQRDLGPILDALRQSFPDTTIRVGSLEELVTAIRESQVADRIHQGELVGGRHQLILSGVWSTRTYLKQFNERCETLLSRVLEPLACWRHFVGGADYPVSACDHLWKLLLQNHPHDSICGCSIDPVHREMVTRFEGVLAGGREQIRELLASPPSRDDHDPQTLSITVFNPLPTRRTDVVRRLLVVPPDLEPSELVLVDDREQLVPFAVTAAHRVARFWHRDVPGAVEGPETLEWLERYRLEFPERFDVQGNGDEPRDLWLGVEFEASLPPVGARSFRLRQRDADRALPMPPPLATSDSTLENDLVRVTLHPDGRLDLLDRRTGTAYANLNRLESTEDAGDEYDYAPAAETHTVTTDGLHGTVRVVGDSGLRATLETTFDWPLPHGLALSRKRRAEQAVACPVRIRISITRGSPMVELRIDIANRAADHRVRSRFIAGEATHLLSDGHFYVNKRPLEIAQHPNWVQHPTGTYPQQEFSAVELEDGNGLAVLNRGLYEVTPIRAGDGSAGFAVTLLRAVGWLSRDDLSTRSMKVAGPMIPTPDAQCIGLHRFELGLLPFTDDSVSSDVRQRSAMFRVHPVSIQGSPLTDSDRRHGLLEVSGTGIATSAIKKHDERDTLIVRLYNTTGTDQTAALTTDQPIARAWETSLLEVRLDAVPSSASLVEYGLGPHQIATLEIAFA